MAFLVYCFLKKIKIKSGPQIFTLQMPATGFSSPPVSFQQWLHWDKPCMLRCLLSNIRTRTWLCCWRTAGPLQHKIPMTHNDGIFSSKGPTPLFLFEAITLFHFWKLQVTFLRKKKNSLSKCCLYSSCPFEGDSHRTVLLPVTSSVELEVPSLHKRFVVKLFSFVKPQTSDKLVSKLFKYVSFFSIFNRNWVAICFDRFISIVMSTSAKDQLAPSLAEAVCTDLSLTVSENWVCSFDWVWTTVTSPLIFQEGRCEEEELRKFFFALCTHSSVNNPPKKDFLKLKKTMKIYLNQ